MELSRIMEYEIVDKFNKKFFTHTTSENVYMEGPAILDTDGNVNILATEEKIQNEINFIANTGQRTEWGLD